MSRGLRFLSPEGSVGDRPAALAAPVASLAGQRLAVLDNGKPNAGLLLRTIADRLAARTGAGVSLVAAKATAAEPAEPDILQQLAAARVVITGSAD